LLQIAVNSLLQISLRRKAPLSGTASPRDVVPDSFFMPSFMVLLFPLLKLYRACLYRSFFHCAEKH
jgi:hypothetical protein